MALTIAPAGQLSFDLVDETGSPSKFIAHFPSSQLASVVQTNANTLAPLLQAITGCSIRGYSYTYSLNDPAATAAVAGSRVEHKGRFQYRLSNGLETRFEVPGLLPDVVLGDGAIDLTNADVLAFVGAISTGTPYSGVDGSDIVQLIAAYEAFRRSTKRQLPTRRFAS